MRRLSHYRPSMGLFGRALTTAPDRVEVAVLERWRAEAAIEALRAAGIRADAVDARGRRSSWAAECTAELVTHEHRLLVTPTSCVMVPHADAARARRLLCELRDDD